MRGVLEQDGYGDCTPDKALVQAQETKKMASNTLRSKVKICNPE